jgi:hypothetical protein
MPDLNGTWKVAIHPTAPETSPEKVIAYMVIRQTFSTVSLRLFTAESHSETLSARVVRCDDGTCNLAAVYRNTPRLQARDRSPLHHGALLLNVQVILQGLSPGSTGRTDCPRVSSCSRREAQPSPTRSIRPRH